MKEGVDDDMHSNSLPITMLYSRSCGSGFRLGK